MNYFGPVGLKSGPERFNRATLLFVMFHCIISSSSLVAIFSSGIRVCERIQDTEKLLQNKWRQTIQIRSTQNKVK